MFLVSSDSYEGFDEFDEFEMRMFRPGGLGLLRGREEVLEKSNTWSEQVLKTLNTCWRALLESLSNTQANVRCERPCRPGLGG